MFWTLLPFGVVVILVLGMLWAASASGHKPDWPALQGVCLMEKSGKQVHYQGKRFAVVEEDTPIRFLSREEFESLKQGNSNFLEMTAGDIVYLTEPPS